MPQANVIVMDHFRSNSLLQKLLYKL